jgi:hypothetical protein
MTPEPATADRDLWLNTLAEGARLLEAGKAQEAAQVLTGLNALCDPSAPRPSQELAAQARELLERCYQAEASLRRSVVESLSRLASGQRAQAYRVRGQGSR